jgi:uncharacterized protein (TIGR02217 family)
MAFHDVRLPDDIEKGASGGPGFKTTVTPLTSGHEQRNIDWDKARGRWDIGYGLMKQDDVTLQATVDIILAFFYTREGKAHGFRFKDWSDFRIGTFSTPTTDNQSIGTGDDSQTTFQVFKRYSSGGIDYDRDVTHIVAATFAVLFDNVVQATPAVYTIDLLTGIITFVSPPGGGVDVQVALEFDVPVRFDTDLMDLNVQIFESGAWPNIPILELRQ